MYADEDKFFRMVRSSRVTMWDTDLMMYATWNGSLTVNLYDEHCQAIGCHTMHPSFGRKISDADAATFILNMFSHYKEDDDVYT